MIHSVKPFTYMQVMLSFNSESIPTDSANF